MRINTTAEATGGKVKAAVQLNLWKKHLGRVPESVREQTTLETLLLAEDA